MPDGNDTTDMVTVCRQLILGGRAADAVEFLRGQPGLPVERRLRLVLGDAQRAGGDLDAALATYRQMDQSGDRSTDAAVAFRHRASPLPARGTFPRPRGVRGR